MNSFQQLICILISFGYGTVLGVFYSLIDKLTNKMNLIFRIFLYIICVILLAILYIYVIYKVNGGIVNIYFYGLIVSGYIFFNVKKRKI